MENVAGPALPYAIRSDRKTAGNTSTGATNGTFVDIPFETNDLDEGVAGLITKPNNTDFTIAQPGIYKAAVTLTADPAANDIGWEFRGVLDGVALPQSRAIGTGRSASQENASNQIVYAFKTTTANQVLKVQAAPTEGVAVNIVPTYSHIFVELVRLT